MQNMQYIIRVPVLKWFYIE